MQTIRRQLRNTKIYRDDGPPTFSIAVDEKMSSPPARRSNFSGIPGADRANQNVLTESPSPRVYLRHANRPAGMSISSSAMMVVAAGIEACSWNSSQVDRSRSGSVKRTPSGVSVQDSRSAPSASPDTNRVTWTQGSLPARITSDLTVRPGGQPTRISSAVNGVGR